MILRTNVSRDGLYQAAHIAHVGFDRLIDRPSRTHDHAYNIILSGSTSNRRGNTGQYGSRGGSDNAATYDEHGIFLAHLYVADPTMRFALVYTSAEHFHWATGDRYRTLQHADQHVNHKWEHQGVSAGGTYVVQECVGTKHKPGCGAIRRILSHGHKFEELSLV